MRVLGPPARRRILGEMGLAPLRWRGRPSAVPAAAEPPPAPTKPTQAARGPMSDPLWQALLRAVGTTATDPATLGWEERLDGPPFEFDGPTLRINPIALRQQPRAKRALWKTLRALRRRLAEQR